MSDNIQKVNFNTNCKILEQVELDIIAVAEKYAGQIPLASFIGVLEIIKQGYLNNGDN